MLNVKKVSELLAKNVDPNIYSRLFLMSPNGTLIAYSTPVDIKELRDQAALISMAWKEHEASSKSKAGHADSGQESSQDANSAPSLETMTIEFQSNNLIVRAVQPKLLLVLVGVAPPSQDSVFRITVETRKDERYPFPSDKFGSSSSLASHRNVSLDQASHSAVNQLSSSVPTSHMSQRERDMKLGILHIQRKKLDALTRFIRSDFDSTGFIMPDDNNFP